MSNNVTPFPLDPKRRVPFRIGGREHVLIIPEIPLAHRPDVAEVIPIFAACDRAGDATGRGADIGLHSWPNRGMNVLTTMDVAGRSKMKTPLTDSESKIATVASGAEGEVNAVVAAERFSSVEEFAEMTQDWPLSRLVAMWNGLPGVTPVSRFTDRKTAVMRIWKALRNPAGAANGSSPSPKRARRGRSKAVAREGSKKARILTLLQQAKGATLDEIMRATGWQAHSVRGFISGNLGKRMGLKVNSTRRSGRERSYRILRG
jgi:hypothetical protein